MLKGIEKDIIHKLGKTVSPLKRPQASLDELLQFVKGPAFSTGGIYFWLVGYVVV
ncbi:hypothetical protein [Ligilactobacillus agilis]|uniref:hypothetical protein n=1 Tax=Ligilactobacillus agilis TaxID=1601 RepID=UPI001959582E|nr:hypothetical protein [Ligilactobacillus agilis]MBM6762789.1 hypothetical protein [Ligilactobacillus agilis]